MNTILSQLSTNTNSTAANDEELLDYIERADSSLTHSVSRVNASLAVISARLDSNMADLTRQLATIDSTVSNLNYTIIASSDCNRDCNCCSSNNTDSDVWIGDAYTSFLPPMVREVTGSVVIDSDTSHFTNLVQVRGTITCAAVPTFVQYPPCVAKLPALQYAGSLSLGFGSPWSASMPSLSRVDYVSIRYCSGNVEFPSLSQVDQDVFVQCDSFNVSFPALTTIGGNLQVIGTNVIFSANNLTHVTAVDIFALEAQLNSLQALPSLTLQGVEQQGRFSFASLRTIQSLYLYGVAANQTTAPNVTTVSYYQYYINPSMKSNLWDTLPMFQLLQYVDKIRVTFWNPAQWCMGSTWNYPQFMGVRVGASFDNHPGCLNTTNILSQLKLSSCQGTTTSMTCGTL
jgi:hypothetical protein